MKGINWAGVVAATVLGVIIGIVWYGMLFKAQWMTLMGITKAADSDTTLMILGVVNTAVSAVGLSWLINRQGGCSAVGGLTTGMLAAIFFACTTDALSYIYAGANTGLVPINFGYLLVLYGVMGATVAAVKLPSGAAAAA